MRELLEVAAMVALVSFVAALMQFAEPRAAPPHCIAIGSVLLLGCR